MGSLDNKIVINDCATKEPTIQFKNTCISHGLRITFKKFPTRNTVCSYHTEKNIVLLSTNL